jgi:hypothetical protein
MRWDAKESRLDGSGRSATAAKGFGEEIQILGVPAQSNSYVYSITVGKVLVSPAYYTGYPSDFLYVRERFPPLRDRIGSWTNERLTLELDDGSGLFATNRDEILLTELLRRGISAGEFRQLFDAPGPFRVEHVMRTLANTHREAQYSGGLRDMLLAQAPGVHRSEETVRVALQYLKRSPNADLCDVVSQFLARGAFAPWTFYYMEQRGHTREHYEAVERAVLPPGVPGAERARADALGQIRQRVPGADDGRQNGWGNRPLPR